MAAKPSNPKPGNLIQTIERVSLSNSRFRP